MCVLLASIVSCQSNQFALFAGCIGNEFSFAFSLSMCNLIKSNCKAAEGIQRSRRAAGTPCMLSAETQLFIFKFVCLLKATTPRVQSHHDVYAMCCIKCYFNVRGQLSSRGKRSREQHPVQAISGQAEIAIGKGERGGGSNVHR